MSVWAELRTIPNLLSLLRLALVPVFLYLILADYPLLAFLVLALASFTDWLDGYLARKLNQVTRIGALLDPAADRLYIFATLIGLAITGAIPAWLPMVVIGRDLLLVFTIPVLASRNFGPLPVHFAGKAGTFARRLVAGGKFHDFANRLGVRAMGRWTLLVCRVPLSETGFRFGEIDAENLR